MLLITIYFNFNVRIRILFDGKVAINSWQWMNLISGRLKLLSSFKSIWYIVKRKKASRKSKGSFVIVRKYSSKIKYKKWFINLRACDRILWSCLNIFLMLLWSTSASKKDSNTTHWTRTFAKHFINHTYINN